MDLLAHQPNELDILVGIAASGTTPYVIGALTEARKVGLLTASVTCNPNAPVSQAAEHPIEVIVGPEFVTGSTRMKSGTAQKLVLNMISTSVMIQLGRVEDNKMVNMQLSNDKLVDRGVKMVMQNLHLTNYDLAKELLLKNGTVKKAMENYQP
jgi:N-acetylmuramic acid 6-phosphate etherase